VRTRQASPEGLWQNRPFSVAPGAHPPFASPGKSVQCHRGARWTMHELGAERGLLMTCAESWLGRQQLPQWWVAAALTAARIRHSRRSPTRRRGSMPSSRPPRRLHHRHRHPHRQGSRQRQGHLPAQVRHRRRLSGVAW
jgi:hypothetical protein